MGGGARLAIRSQRGPRRLQDDRRRQDVEEDAVRQQRDRRARGRGQHGSNPNEVYAGMYRGFRKGWDIISGGASTEGGIYKSMDGGETWKKLEAGLPAPLIGKIDIDIARSQPNIVYAMIEAPGEQGGLYRSDDSGATWRMVNNAGNLRVAPLLFQLRRRQSEEPGRGLGQRARPLSSRPTAASSSPRCRRRTATITASGSTPTIRSPRFRSTTAAPT